MHFDHERLDVYKTSLKFFVLSTQIINSFPKGKSFLADQLNRASASITLNVAEGAGEFSRADKARFYRMAKRSATECAACLDICRGLEIADVNPAAFVKHLRYMRKEDLNTGLQHACLPTTSNWVPTS